MPLSLPPPPSEEWRLSMGGGGSRTCGDDEVKDGEEGMAWMMLSSSISGYEQ